MTAPDAVDVRAVLAEVRSFMASTHPQYETAEKLDAVHAAVSALIDADKNFDAMLQRQEKYPCPGMDEHVRRAKFRRAVALARCGGAQ